MLEGWYLITVALLLLSGGAKIADPEPTRGALRAAGLPSGRWAALALGLVEVIVASVALGWGGAFVTAAVGLLYLSFAGFVAWALARKFPLQSCGCFGRADTPPTSTHLIVNLLAGLAALAIAIGGGTSLVEVLAGQPGWGVPYLAYTAIGTAALTLTLTSLPTLFNRTAA